MYKQMKLSAVCVAVLCLSTFVAGCGLLGGDTAKANKLIDEGNTLNQEGNSYAIDGANKLKEIDAQMAGFPSNRAEIKAPAQDAIATFDKSIAKLREATAKYDEAVKLNVEQKFKEYLSLQTKAIRKEIEKLEALNEMPKQLLDESNKDAETINKKLEAIGERVTRLNQEQKDLESQAGKVREQNPNLFKS
jgi:outer membrane murein-binding lipoprotein Lpp